MVTKILVFSCLARSNMNEAGRSRQFVSYSLVVFLYIFFMFISSQKNFNLSIYQKKRKKCYLLPLISLLGSTCLDEKKFHVLFFIFGELDDNLIGYPCRIPFHIRFFGFKKLNKYIILINNCHDGVSRSA